MTKYANFNAIINTENTKCYVVFKIEVQCNWPFALVDHVMIFL